MYFDKKEIIKNLPNYKLSYAKILHNKVQSDYAIIIPKGIKCLLWFTYFKENNICFLLELDYQNNIKSISSELCSFSDELAQNTLVYGTLLSIDGIKFFSCENILMYKNQHVQTKNFKYKLAIFKDFFDNITNLSISNSIIITLAYVCTTYEEALAILPTLKYNVYSIVLQNKNEYYSKGIIKQFNKKQEAIFKMTASINSDIYNLYCLDNDMLSNIFYDFALINDFTTSKKMNAVFRTIKENENLDLLEESDDEEEFENINEDKFVNLKISKLVKCVYVAKFKKWKPVDFVNDNFNIVSIKTLQGIQQHYKKK